MSLEHNSSHFSGYHVQLFHNP